MRAWSFQIFSYFDSVLFQTVRRKLDLIIVMILSHFRTQKLQSKQRRVVTARMVKSHSQRKRKVKWKQRSYQLKFVFILYQTLKYKKDWIKRYVLPRADVPVVDFAIDHWNILTLNSNPSTCISGRIKFTSGSPSLPPWLHPLPPPLVSITCKHPLTVLYRPLSWIGQLL